MLNYYFEVKNNFVHCKDGFALYDIVHTWSFFITYVTNSYKSVYTEKF